jgi:hypothetical protein
MNVYTASDVLQIDDDGVYVGDHFLGRFADLAVQRIDHDAGTLVTYVRRLDHVVLYIATDAVLWPKERRQLECVVRSKHIGSMGKCVGQHRGLIADKTDALPTDQVDLFTKKNFDT